MIHCPNCRAECEESATFCVRCGLRLNGEGDKTSRPLSPPKIPVTNFPLPSLTGRSGSRRRFLLAGGAVLLLLLLGGFWLLNPFHFSASSVASSEMSPAQVQGEFWFYTYRTQNDGIALSLSHLAPLPANQAYVAWLSNPLRPNQYLLLSPLQPDQSGTVMLRSEQLPSFNSNGSNLPAVFTRLVITRELVNTNPARPSGPAVLQGILNIEQTPELQPLLFGGSDLPGHESLAAGFQTRIQELERRMREALDAQKQRNPDVLQLQAARLLYLLEGASGPDVQRLQLVANNNVRSAGDGVALSVAGCQPGQTSCGYLEQLRANIQSLATNHALSAGQNQQLMTMLDTMTARTHTLEQQVLPLVATRPKLDQTDATQLAQLAYTMDTLQSGQDLNGDGTIDPVPGEAAAAQFGLALQHLGVIPLTPVKS